MLDNVDFYVVKKLLCEKIFTWAHQRSPHNYVGVEQNEHWVSLATHKPINNKQEDQPITTPQQAKRYRDMATYTSGSSVVFEAPSETWKQLSVVTNKEDVREDHRNKPGAIVLAFLKIRPDEEKCSVTHQMLPVIFSWRGSRNQTWSIPTEAHCRVLVSPADGSMYVHEIPNNRVQTAQSFVARSLLEQLFNRGRAHRDTEPFRQCVEIMESFVTRPMVYSREVEEKGDCLSFELSDNEFWWLHSNGTVYLELNLAKKYEMRVPFAFSDARLRVANLFTRKKCEASMRCHDSPRRPFNGYPTKKKTA